MPGHLAETEAALYAAFLVAVVCCYVESLVKEFPMFRVPVLRCLLAIALFALPIVPATADDAPPSTPAPSAEDLTVSVPTWGNATCPIMGKPASEALYVDVKFGRIYICCPPCARKIRAEPAVAYRAAYPTATRIDNKVDPVTGSVLGEKTVTMELQGYEFKVCADGCEAKAREHSQVTLVHLLMPDVVDVRNERCPIDGQPVVANAICLIGKNLVRLSSPKHVAQVRADPAAALAKAREYAPK